jgi:hypothetical protein
VSQPELVEGFVVLLLVNLTVFILLFDNSGNKFKFPAIRASFFFLTNLLFVFQTE